MAYSLKAACSHCRRYGTVDDATLICHHCGQTHEVTSAQLAARDAEHAFVRVVYKGPRKQPPERGV
jgi:Fe2+ or Zn2+ uptake regulation protein